MSGAEQCLVDDNYVEIIDNDTMTPTYMCRFGGPLVDNTDVGCVDPYSPGGLTDMSEVSIHSLNCDPCETKQKGTGIGECEQDDPDDPDNTCFWNVTNSSEGDQCLDRCRSRMTKGECEQYHVFNESSLSERIYSYDGNDGECIWRPNVGAMDTTVDSPEGICRRRDQLCYAPCNGTGDCNVENESCVEFKEDSYCVNHKISKLDIGGVYCGEFYETPNDCPIDPSDCGDSCELYRDPRYSSDSQQNGICISDGMENIDLLSGEHLGLIMTDQQCQDAMNVQAGENEYNACSNIKFLLCTTLPRTRILFT